ncbi:MAG: hypothetical protein L0Z63_02415 [Actinobacteria bacterium]|nr:hypothetical protein [Actinomycetota bacterium]
MKTKTSEDGAADPATIARRSRLTRLVFWLVVGLGAATSVFVLARTDDDPVETMLSAWPVVLGAAVLYVIGMTLDAIAWSRLFTEDRRALALGFILSQPVKYMPGGFAQPLGQMALAVETIGRTSPVLVAFPVHVLINVVAATTLGALVLFVADVPGWARWLVILTPLVWILLDRRWMGTVLEYLGRRVPRLRVDAGVPSQGLINRSFGFALAGHGLMFLSFGVLTDDAIGGWSVIQLAIVYAIAWLVGYVVIPSPAGLGAREAALLALLAGTLTASEVIAVATVHRVMTMICELGMMGVAVLLARRRPTIPGIEAQDSFGPGSPTGV